MCCAVPAIYRPTAPLPRLAGDTNAAVDRLRALLVGWPGAKVVGQSEDRRAMRVQFSDFDRKGAYARSGARAATPARWRRPWRAPQVRTRTSANSTSFLPATTAARRSCSAADHDRAPRANSARARNPRRRRRRAPASLMHMRRQEGERASLCAGGAEGFAKGTRLGAARHRPRGPLRGVRRARQSALRSASRPGTRPHNAFMCCALSLRRVARRRRWMRRSLTHCSARSMATRCLHLCPYMSGDHGPVTSLPHRIHQWRR